MWHWLRKYLWPVEAERDPEFKAEIERLARRGLYITGIVEIGMPVVGRILGWIVNTDRPRPLWETIGFVTLGMVTLSLIRSRLAKRHARALCVASGAACMTLMSATDLLSIRNPVEAAACFALDVTTVLFVAVAAFPILPLQTAGLGLWSTVVLAGTVWAGMQTGLLEHAPAPAYSVVWVLLLTLLATGLSAINYSRLYTMFRTHRNRLEYQSRLLLSENSAAMGKFVAALNHEMNSPLGALASTMQTLPSILERYDAASPEKRASLRETANELCATAAASVVRLSEIAGRMRRMVNLDRADVQAVDVNALLKDLAVMVGGIDGQSERVELELNDLPPLVCRPQQISAVFGAMLHEALESSPSGSLVTVTTRCAGDCIEVAVRDRGPGLAPEDANQLLEPRFTVASNRVSGNWNLFTSRQIIADHGGEIRINGHQEGGKTITVSLHTNGRLRLAS